MKKTFLCYLIIIALSFSSIVFANNHDILFGFWNFGFPVSSGTWGYLFLDNGRFIYYDSSKENGYFGTTGKWKEEKNRIYLLPEKDLLRNSDNFYVLRSKYKDWQLISDIRSVNFYWYPSEKNELEYPPSISIKIFENREITPYVKNYYKLYDLEKVKKNDISLIDLFEHTNYAK